MIGDIFVDGKSPEPTTGIAMCEKIVAAGLYDGDPLDIWNASPSGELMHVAELYYAAIMMEGRCVQLDIGGGRLLNMATREITEPKN